MLDDPICIQDKGFRRPVDTQVYAKRALVINDVELVRVTVVLEPFGSFGRIVVVVDPVDGNTVLDGNPHQFGIFHGAIRAPRCPDIDQRDLPLDVGGGQHAVRVFQ